MVPITIGACSAFWLLSDLQRRERLRQRERFFAGLCLQCGYDLRGAAARCPECGGAVWKPDRPLVLPEQHWSSLPARFLLSTDPAELIDWMLERRPITDASAWGDDIERQRIGAVVSMACWRWEDSSGAKFLPGDPFYIISASTFREAFVREVWRNLGIQLSTEELSRFEQMTLGEVVDVIVARAAVRSPT